MNMLTTLKNESVSVSMLSSGDAAMGVKMMPSATIKASIFISSGQMVIGSPSDTFDPM